MLMMLTLFHQLRGRRIDSPSASIERIFIGLLTVRWTVCRGLSGALTQPGLAYSDESKLRFQLFPPPSVSYGLAGGVGGPAES